jgi:hypothetical protein
MAVCLGCKHEWQFRHLTKSDSSEDVFDCPECGLSKGVPAGLYRPAVGTTIYVCNCGCDVFFMLSGTLMCRNCGSLHDNYLG